MNNQKLIEKARAKARLLQIARRDPRYLKALGKLRHEGLLDAQDVPEYRGQVFLQDALWASEFEPRILELLPAIIARRPRLFTFLELPDDLKVVVHELKQNRFVTPYRGIEPQKYAFWDAFILKDRSPAKVLRSFRLSLDDVQKLEMLAEKKSTSQAKIIHLALRSFE